MVSRCQTMPIGSFIVNNFVSLYESTAFSPWNTELQQWMNSCFFGNATSRHLMAKFSGQVVLSIPVFALYEDNPVVAVELTSSRSMIVIWSNEEMLKECWKGEVSSSCIRFRVLSIENEVIIRLFRSGSDCQEMPALSLRALPSTQITTCPTAMALQLVCFWCSCVPVHQKQSHKCLLSVYVAVSSTAILSFFLFVSDSSYPTHHLIDPSLAADVFSFFVDMLLVCL